jgi:hypothetical protein
VAAEGVTDGPKWEFGVVCGSVAGKGVSGFWLLFTTDDTTDNMINQWLIRKKQEKT